MLVPIAALVAVLALATPPALPRCVVVEITAVGQSAHGATPLPHSAAHRLIRALDRLPAWTQSSAVARRHRIVALRSAPAVNIIASRATARVEIEIGGSESVLSELRSALGSDVEASVSPDSCGVTVAGGDARR
jgi:acetylornithine deacetylase/succinyl-diaminopimelate desuccinylase-like protein